jgi:hypothetical protein
MDIININLVYDEWQQEEKLYRTYLQQQELIIFLFLFYVTVVYIYYFNLYCNFILFVNQLKENYKIIKYLKHTP